MNLIEIAIFKHYVKDRGIRKPFRKNYMQSLYISKNPTAVEDFLSNVEPLVVITKAIRSYNRNSPFGFEFWQDVNAEWKEYYERIKKKGGAIMEGKGLKELDGYFKVLRENWDSKDPTVWEDLNVALRRYGLSVIDTPDEMENAPAGDDSEEESTGDELEFVDLKKTNFKSSRLCDNEGSVNTRHKGYRLLVARNISQFIRDKEFIYCRLATNKAGELIVHFNREGNSSDFIRLTDSCMDVNRNVTVNSKLFVMYIRKFFNTDEDYFLVQLEQTQTTDNFVNYKIIKK